MPFEKKYMWQREMECLLCVSDHIVEFKPSWQTLADGSKLEVILHSPFDFKILMNIIVLTHVSNHATLGHVM